jgi:hypothetical protein
MQWMLDLRMYGLKIHYNSTTPGHVTWMGQDELLYKDIAFTMGDFRGFVHGLVNVTRQILREQLLLTSETTEVPAIPWDQLRDDPTQAKAGWSYTLLSIVVSPYPMGVIGIRRIPIILYGYGFWGYHKSQSGFDIF